jgi:hypothetical protein
VGFYLFLFTTAQESKLQPRFLIEILPQIATTVKNTMFAKLEGSRQETCGVPGYYTAVVQK